MSTYLKTYKIELEVLSPIFIGAGYSHGKKDTIYDLDRHKVFVPNTRKMFQWIRENGLENQYESFVMSGKDSLYIWLRKNGVSGKNYMEWVDYALDATDTDLEGERTKEVHCFMKDAYGRPYVPGSSLKGAIRTAVLAQEIIENRENSFYMQKAQKIKSAEFKGRRDYLSKEMKEIEVNALYTRGLVKGRYGYTDAVNDVFGGIRISDSKPLNIEDLILCKKIDYTPRGDKKEHPLLRECIRPGTKIEFDLTIDTIATKIDVEKIKKSIHTFLKSYNESFNNRFKNKANYDEDVLYLGGGCGFVSKTILYPLLGKDSIKDVSEIIANVSKKADHKNDIRIGASPHKIKKTKYNNELYSYGACKVSIVASE